VSKRWEGLPLGLPPIRPNRSEPANHQENNMYIGVLELAARLAEKESRWRDAAVCWRKLDSEAEARVCEAIADSNELGDAWRALPDPKPDFRSFAHSYKDGELVKRLTGVRW
jgi:hypothetical protein